MIRYEKEIKCGFDKLLDLVIIHEHDVFTLVYNDKLLRRSL